MKMKIGAHVSIAGGYLTALKQAKTLGASTIQIFASSPRTWAAPRLTAKQADSFHRQAQKQKVGPVFIHAKYLINLASQTPATVEKSINSLVQDLKVAAQISSPGVIFHPHLGRNNLLAENVSRVLARAPKQTNLIFENAATIQLAELINFFLTLKTNRVKICLDTAHLFQSGLAINTPVGLKKMYALIKKAGWSNLALIHANDSRTASGSKHDVHENIGRGQLGEEVFHQLTHHAVMGKLPFILETPAGKNDLKKQKKNLDKIRTLSQT